MVLGVTIVLTTAVCIPVYGLELLGAVRLDGFASLDLGLTVFTVFSGLMYGIIRIGLGATATVRRYAENPQAFSFIRRASSVRAGLEGTVASIALFFLLAPLLLFDPGAGDFWAWSLLIAWIGLAIGFSIRAQFPSGMRWKIIFHELALLAAVNAFYYTGICLSIILLGWVDRPGMWWFLPPAGEGPGFFALFITVAFILARGSGWMGFLINSAAKRRDPGAEAREAQPHLLFFFRTGFWRAALEGMAGTFLLSWAVLFDPLRFGNVFQLIIPGIFLAWCALRLPLTSGHWPKRLQREIGFALAYGALLSVALCAAVICLSIPLSGQSWEQLPSIFLLGTPVLALIFGVFRAVITLIHVWRRFQRRSMVLSLTNAILSIIFAGIALIAALWALTLIFATDLPVEPSLQPNIISQAFHRLSFVLVPLLGVMVLLILFSLLFILPPAILFSYLVARSNTRRIRELADAAGAMRGGNYSVQVAVEGEDEVARLQSDFNAMATDLDRTVREVQTEHDRVTGLLQSRRELIAGVSAPNCVRRWRPSGCTWTFRPAQAQRLLAGAGTHRPRPGSDPPAEPD